MVRVWLTVVAVALLAAGAAGAAVFAWPAGRLGASPSGLASLSLPGYAGRVDRVSVTDAHGNRVPVVIRHGTILPRTQVAAGERLTVRVGISRPSWIGWLVGRRLAHTMTVVTPVARVRTTLLRPPRGSSVSVRFDKPVSRYAVGTGPARASGHSVVPLGVVASGAASVGTTSVAAAARPWEKLSKPVRVSWFVAGSRPQVIAAPANGASLAPLGLVTLTFPQPVTSVLGSRLPRLEPATPGHWEQVDSHTLSFRPTGYGFGLGGTVHVQLPGQSLTWKVDGGSTLRLQELLARQGYLPLNWHPATDPPSTPASELAAAISPPQGTFSWRYPQTPSSLRGLWRPGGWNVVTQGAVMRFEDVHGLATDGIAGPQVWRALLHDEVAHKRSDAGYSYVFVHKNLPQSLTLWHDGRVIVTSPGNTGIPQAPTASGTWPVFEHIPVGTMSGTNPDGSHYNDPGIRWISYFHGGDALHAFPRASFGTPQSLGCVELPNAAAAQVWPYTPIGTLVTIEN